MHRMMKWLLLAGTGAALLGGGGCGFGGFGGFGGSTLGQLAVELVDIAAGAVAGFLISGQPIPLIT